MREHKHVLGYMSCPDVQGNVEHKSDSYFAQTYLSVGVLTVLVKGPLLSLGSPRCCRDADIVVSNNTKNANGTLRKTFVKLNF